MFGAYQAGAWKTLSREISPDIVIGASVGALNGWYIASGVPAEELERRWLDPSCGELMTYRMPRSPLRGVFDPRPLETSAKFLVNNYELRLGYCLTLLELPALRRKLVCDSAVTWRHLVASCAVPGGFAPVRIDGHLYCDGGLLEVLPIWAALEVGATRVIAVNAARFIPPPGLPLVIKAARAIGRRIRKVPPPAEGGPDVVMIEPTSPLGKMLDGTKWRREQIQRWIELGESDAAAALESIRAREGMAPAMG